MTLSSNIFVLAFLLMMTFTSAVLEGPYTWERTGWWNKKHANMPHQLKKCVFLNHIAQDGEACPGILDHDYYCMFGTAWECETDGEVVDAEPEWICMCNEQTWKFECKESDREPTC